MGIEVVSSTTVISRLIEMEVTEGAVHALLSMTQGDLIILEIVGLDGVLAGAHGDREVIRKEPAKQGGKGGF